MICKGIKAGITPVEDKIPNFNQLSGRQKLNAIKKLNCRRRKDVV